MITYCRGRKMIYGINCIKCIKNPEGFSGSTFTQQSTTRSSLASTSELLHNYHHATCGIVKRANQASCKHTGGGC
jgi:hypothetical protein